jgi:hypothetical protein
MLFTDLRTTSCLPVNAKREVPGTTNEFALEHKYESGSHFASLKLKPAGALVSCITNANGTKKSWPGRAKCTSADRVRGNHYYMCAYHQPATSMSGRTYTCAKQLGIMCSVHRPQLLSPSMVHPFSDHRFQILKSTYKLLQMQRSGTVQSSTHPIHSPVVVKRR